MSTLGTTMPIDPEAARSGMRRADYLLFGVLALGLFAIAGTTFAMWPVGPKPPPLSVVGGPFRLQSSKGGVLDSASLRGKPFLVFFGFTQCPNVCPTTLADLSNLIDELQKQGGDIRALYITLDPERDTAAVLSEYMKSFSDRITALTGTPAEIDRVAASYRAYAKRVPLPDGDYTLEHTLMVYLMDQNGGFIGPLDLGAGHGLALKQLRQALTGHQKS